MFIMGLRVMDIYNLYTKFKFVLLVVVTIALMVVVNISQAATYSFYNIENNTVDISDQLSVEVNNEAFGTTFKFFNDVGITSSVTDIYFDEGSSDLFSGFEIYEQYGAAFAPEYIYYSAANPGNLPGGNAIGFAADYSADSTSNPENGLDTSTDYVTFLAYAGTDYSYDNLLNALLDGSARIGLHVQAFADGASDSYVNSLNPVPVPAAGILFASALFVVGAIGRRKKKSATNITVGAFTRTS